MCSARDTSLLSTASADTVASEGPYPKHDEVAPMTAGVPAKLEGSKGKVRSTHSQLPCQCWLIV